MASTDLPAAPPSPAGETRDHLLARVAFEAIWERDLDTGVKRWDESLEVIFGYPRDEVAATVSWWRERVHPDDLGGVEEAAARAIDGGAPGWASEYRFQKKDGSWAW
ncbi:MAG TPA: PAS domain-containing protein, partial [Gemmatimonadales bacterium]|nr:PAS domain-containing protein [Gemmatimonadales bacterium]